MRLHDTESESGRMGTNRQSKRRKLVKAAFRQWPGRRRKPGDRPSRELRRSW